LAGSKLPQKHVGAPLFAHRLRSQQQLSWLFVTDACTNFGNSNLSPPEKTFDRGVARKLDIYLWLLTAARFNLVTCPDNIESTSHLWKFDENARQKIKEGNICSQGKN
jgi:hypothetical protein